MDKLTKNQKISQTMKGKPGNNRKLSGHKLPGPYGIKMIAEDITMIEEKISSYGKSRGVFFTDAAKAFEFEKKEK